MVFYVIHRIRIHWYITLKTQYSSYWKLNQELFFVVMCYQLQVKSIKYFYQIKLQANEKLKTQGVSTIKSTTSSSSADSMLKPASPPSIIEATYHDVSTSIDANASSVTSKEVMPPDPPSSARSMKSSASILSGKFAIALYYICLIFLMFLNLEMKIS